MQKRRMWKVASAHFAATIFVCFLILHIQHTVGLHTDSLEKRVVHGIWVNFLETTLMILQPLPFLAIWLLQQSHFPIPEHPLWLAVPIFYGFLLLLSLSWSICFGWLYVKFTNWLNHFPILGKKVF